MLERTKTLCFSFLFEAILAVVSLPFVSSEEDSPPFPSLSSSRNLPALVLAFPFAQLTSETPSLDGETLHSYFLHSSTSADEMCSQNFSSVPVTGLKIWANGWKFCQSQRGGICAELVLAKEADM